mgnify:CR=1 FL=1
MLKKVKRKMIQCKDCEMYQEGPEGRRIFKCDPFANIKEPDCIKKWQLMRMDMLREFPNVRKGQFDRLTETLRVHEVPKHLEVRVIHTTDDIADKV